MEENSRDQIGTRQAGRRVTGTGFRCHEDCLSPQSLCNRAKIIEVAHTPLNSDSISSLLNIGHTGRDCIAEEEESQEGYRGFPVSQEVVVEFPETEA